VMQPVILPHPSVSPLPGICATPPRPIVHEASGAPRSVVRRLIERLRSQLGRRAAPKPEEPAR
jgi:hypothetical protein